MHLRACTDSLQLERLDSITISNEQQREAALARPENYRDDLAKLEASVSQWKHKYHEAVEVNVRIPSSLYVRPHN